MVRYALRSFPVRRRADRLVFGVLRGHMFLLGGANISFGHEFYSSVVRTLYLAKYLSCTASMRQVQGSSFATLRFVWLKKDESYGP